MTRELDPDYPVFALSWGLSTYDLIYELIPDTDTAGRRYKMVDHYLEDDNFYEGLDMITVIQRLSDGKLFGYSWWSDNSKHGESYAESNGDEFGLEDDINDPDFDFDRDHVSYFVFEPVEVYSIAAYRKV